GKGEIFVLDQINNYEQLQGARWTEITITHCIIFHARAPRVYEFMRKSGIIHLPCRHTLMAYTRKSTLETGVCSLVKKRLKSEGENLSEMEKHCSLVLDEMTIDPGEEYIPQLDKFVGKIDMGGIIDPNDSTKTATKMLGYILVGLNTYYKIPVAYFLVNQLIAKEQEALTVQVIKDVEGCGGGFKIERLVVDNLAVNTNMFKRMNGGTLHHVIRHPVQQYNEEEISSIPLVKTKNIIPIMYGSLPCWIRQFCEDCIARLQGVKCTDPLMKLIYRIDRGGLMYLLRRNPHCPNLAPKLPYPTYFPFLISSATHCFTLDSVSRCRNRPTTPQSVESFSLFARLILTCFLSKSTAQIEVALYITLGSELFPFVGTFGHSNRSIGSSSRFFSHCVCLPSELVKCSSDMDAIAAVEATAGPISADLTTMRGRRTTLRRQMTTAGRQIENLTTSRGSRTLLQGLLHHCDGLVLKASILQTELSALEDEEECERQENTHLTYVTTAGVISEAANQYLDSREGEEASWTPAGVSKGVEGSWLRYNRRADEARERLERARMYSENAQLALQQLHLGEMEQDRFTSLSHQVMDPPTSLTEKWLSQQRQANLKSNQESPDDWIDQYSAGLLPPSGNKQSSRSAVSAELDPFNGKVLEWFRWIDLFRALLHDTPKTPGEKLALLKR
ncbi:Uncharacterized protein APZ42_032401, partial [Daphnia magna]